LKDYLKEIERKLNKAIDILQTLEYRLVIETTNGTCTMYTILIQNGNYANNFERDTLEGKDYENVR